MYMYTLCIYIYIYIYVYPPEADAVGGDVVGRPRLAPGVDLCVSQCHLYDISYHIISYYIILNYII